MCSCGVFVAEFASEFSIPGFVIQIEADCSNGIHRYMKRSLRTVVLHRLRFAASFTLTVTSAPQLG